MSKLVIDVGQCAPDHAAIRRMLDSHFDVRIVQTHGMDDTLAALAREPAELVLVNRKLDRDYSDGTDIIRRIKSDDSVSSAPVMLVSNCPEHQRSAVQLGAEPGFGKAELDTDLTHAKLKALLG